VSSQPQLQLRQQFDHPVVADHQRLNPQRDPSQRSASMMIQSAGSVGSVARRYVALWTRVTSNGIVDHVGNPTMAHTRRLAHEGYTRVEPDLGVPVFALKGGGIVQFFIWTGGGEPRRKSGTSPNVASQEHIRGAVSHT